MMVRCLVPFTGKFVCMLLFLLIVYQLVNVESLVLSDSLLALQDLHTATNGEQWQYPLGDVVWNFSQSNVDPCAQRWSGITCNEAADDITGISLSNYGLHGQLPPSLVNLSSLNLLKVEKNSLSGSFPWESFYTLTTLSYLYLNENNFHGSLPQDLHKLAHINLLKLRETGLTGSIPDSFGDISNLGEVHLSLNSLTGSLPSTISKLTKLYYFSVRYNQITNTIPSFFGDLAFLEQFSVYNNKMVGTIPPELGNLQRLEFFVAHTNDFEGTIPATLGSATSLQVLSLSNNLLTGSIPDTLCQLTNIFEMELSNNSLTSSLPSCITNWINLETLYLHDNFLQGTLPLNLGNTLRKLLNFDLSFNSLSGSIPASLATLPGVLSVVLHSNRFSGNLNFITNESLSQCTFFDIADNHLSGPLPTELFRLPQMQYLLLSKNCFSGVIPESICGNTNIKTLSMNALASGDECDITRIWKSYFPSKDFGGAIPACLWDIPSLVTLYLSGNMLEGNVEDITIPDTSLLDVVSLSGNALTGYIPISFQTRNFSHLDISWNKITGTLDAMENHYGEGGGAAANGLINMEVNYISGRIPHYILSGADVRVLNGNLFECSKGSFRAPDLPQNDASASGYACGSAEFDLSLLLYFLVFVVSVGISVRLVYKINYASSPWLAQEVKRFFRNQSDYLVLTDMYPPRALRGYVKTLHQLLKTMCILTAGVVLFSILAIPMLRNEDLSTSTHLYGWYMSFMYFQGSAPGLVYFFLWTASVFYFSFATAAMIETSDQKCLSDKINLIASTRVAEVELPDIGKKPDATKAIQNADICQSSNSSLSPRNDAFNSKANALFLCRTFIVTIINFVCVLTINIYYVIIVLSEHIDQKYKIMAQFAVSIFMCFWNSIAVGFMVTKLYPSIPSEILLRSLFRIVNTVFMPIIAVLFSSSKCFSAFFFGLDDITNVVLYETCSLQTFSNGVITCVEYEYASIEDTIERPFVYNGGCTDAILSDYIPVHIYSYAFDFILMPVVYLISTTWLAKFQNYIVLPKMMWIDTQVEMRELLRAGNLFGAFFGHFALAITFGLTSPVLILVITLAFMQDLVIYIYYMRKYLTFSERCKNPNDPFGGLEDASATIPTTFRNIIFVILFTSAFVNAFMVLDKVWYKDYSFHYLPKFLWALILPFVIVSFLLFIEDKYYDYHLRLRQGRTQ